jgi:hypothetical protein
MFFVVPGVAGGNTSVFFVVLGVLRCVFRSPGGLNTQRAGGNTSVFFVVLDVLLCVYTTQQEDCMGLHIEH